MKTAAKKILVVCTGNTCRSPMAEHLLRLRLGPDSAWTVKSAGTAAPRDMPASPDALAAMREIGVDMSAHRSRPVDCRLVEHSDLIVVMTSEHRRVLAQRFPAATDRIFLLGSFGIRYGEQEIPDPIGFPLLAYRRVRETMESAVADLVLYLREYDQRGRKVRKGEQK